MISGGEFNITKRLNIQLHSYIISLCDTNENEIILNSKNIAASRALIDEQSVCRCLRHQKYYFKI